MVFLDNTGQCAAAIFGVLLAGGVFAVVNPQTKADKLAYILNDCEPSFLIVEGHSAATAAAAVENAPGIKARLRRGRRTALRAASRISGRLCSHRRRIRVTPERFRSTWRR